jgi:hypothetical protein
MNLQIDLSNVGGPDAALPLEPASVADKTCRPTGQFPLSQVTAAVLLVATGLGLVSCGGGGSSAISVPSTVALSGQAIKGPVVGGQVCAYTLEQPRKQLSCATTDSQAQYKLDLPAGTGDVLLEVTGGSYSDEATGKTVALSAPLRAVGKAGSADNQLLTPFTELAVQRATQANAGGNLSLLSFRGEITNLEQSMGLTGLATGKPFGGSGTADVAHQKALVQFAQRQNTYGLSLGDTLKSVGTDLASCSMATGNAGLSYSPRQAISVSSLSTNSGGLSISAADVAISGDLPTPCVDSFVLNGVATDFSQLAQTPDPASWATAKTVEITHCVGTLSGTLNFPNAQFILKTPMASLAQAPIGAIPDGSVAINTVGVGTGVSVSSAGGGTGSIGSKSGDITLTGMTGTTGSSGTLAGGGTVLITGNTASITPGSSGSLVLQTVAVTGASGSSQSGLAINGVLLTSGTTPGTTSASTVASTAGAGLTLVSAPSFCGAFKK